MIFSLFLILAVADPADGLAIQGRASATIVAGEEIDFDQFGARPDRQDQPAVQYSRFRDQSGIATETEQTELLLIEYQ